MLFFFLNLYKIIMLLLHLNVLHIFGDCFILVGLSFSLEWEGVPNILGHKIVEHRGVIQFFYYKNLGSHMMTTDGSKKTDFNTV